MLVKPLGSGGGENVDGGEVKSQSQAGVWVGTVKIHLGVTEVWGTGWLIIDRLTFYIWI